jgi:hypothetical protein
MRPTLIPTRADLTSSRPNAVLQVQADAVGESAIVRLRHAQLSEQLEDLVQRSRATVEESHRLVRASRAIHSASRRIRWQ